MFYSTSINRLITKQDIKAVIAYVGCVVEWAIATFNLIMHCPVDKFKNIYKMRHY